MDLFKTCTTSVHLIEGYSVIHYRCYELPVNASNPQSANTPQALHAAVGALRNHGVLVTTSSKTRLLLFGQSQEQIMERLVVVCPHQNVTDIISIDDLQALQFKIAGSVTAKDMLQDPSFPARSDMPKPASNVVDLTQAEDLLNASRPAASSGSPAYHYQMYKNFISACVQSVVFQMSKTGKVVPLNFRSVVFLPDEFSNSDLLVPQRASLAGLDLSLTAKGDVLVSMRVNQDVLMTNSVLSASRSRNGVIQIAPSGRLTKIVDCSKPQATQPAIAQSDSEFSGESWRSSVSDYLKAYGLDLQACSDLMWCQLRLCENAADAWSFLDGVDENCMFFEWPVYLCFTYPEKGSPDLWKGTMGGETLEDEGFLFFEKLGQEAFKDPLEEAVKFHTGFRQDVNKERYGQQHPSKHKPQFGLSLDRTTDDLDWEPPQQSYIMTQDMAKAMAVYPTPPDGLLAPTSSAVTAQAATDNARTVQDDEYSAASITDADFSFFDDPSPGVIKDVDMSSAPHVVIEEVVTAPAQQIAASSSSISKVKAIPAGHLTVLQSSRDPEPEDRERPPDSLFIEDMDTSNVSFARTSRPITVFSRPASLKRMDDLNTSLGDMDRKYDLNGRFAYLASNERHFATNQKEKQIPHSKASMSDPNALSRDASSWGGFERVDTRRHMLRSPSTSDSDSDADMYPNKRAKTDYSVTIATKPNSNEEGNAIEEGSAGNTASKLQSSTSLRHLMLLDMLCATSEHDWSLSDVPAPSASKVQPTTLDMLDEVDLVEVIQLLSVHLSLSTQSDEHGQFSTSSSDHHIVEIVLPTFQRSLKNAFDTSKNPSQQDSLRNLEVAKVVRNVTTTSKFQPKPKTRVGKTGDIKLTGQSSEESSVFNIGIPMIHLRKGDGDFEVLPSAWTIWDTLGLAPCNGPKKITAVCAYPSCRDAMNESVRAFFRALRSAWVENKLGSHEVLGEGGVLERDVDDDDREDDCPKGLLRVSPTSPMTVVSIMTAYRDYLAKTRIEDIQACLDDGDTVVVYIVNPFDSDSAVFDLVACFHALWKDLEYPHHLVLQIIPMNFITTLGGRTFLESKTLSLLAREVYDRCPLVMSESDLPITSHNAIELAPDPVEDIRFRLTPEAPHDIMHEKSCLHIAYARSSDDNWITVAWTDNIGRYQHQASYHMSRCQSFSNIAREIWSSTMEYIAPQKALWRLFIVCTNPMTLVERKTWRNLAVNAEKQATRFSLTLISINTSPLVEHYSRAAQANQAHDDSGGDISSRLAIASPNVISTPHNHFSPTTPSAMATPRSMPDASRHFSSNVFGTSINSPIAQNTPTPANVSTSVDHDPSARIIDLTDQTCGVILARHLNVSQSITDYHPALASGYLFKRGGVRDTDRPVMLEVNIMAVDLTAAAKPSAGAATQNGSNASIGPPAQKPQQSGPSRLPQRPNLALPPKPPTPLSSMYSAPSPAASKFPSIAPVSSAATTAPSPAALSEADKSALRQRRYNAALREVLVMYRKLAMLAKVRGLQGVEGTAPWHVIVAMRAAEGLRRCVGGGLPGRVDEDE